MNRIGLPDDRVRRRDGHGRPRPHLLRREQAAVAAGGGRQSPESPPMPGAPASSTEPLGHAGPAHAVRHRAPLVRGRRDVRRESAGPRGVPERRGARVRVALPLRLVQRAARYVRGRPTSAPAPTGEPTSRRGRTTVSGDGAARPVGGSSIQTLNGSTRRSPRASRSRSGSRTSVRSGQGASPAASSPSTSRATTPSSRRATRRRSRGSLDRPGSATRCTSRSTRPWTPAEHRRRHPTTAVARCSAICTSPANPDHDDTAPPPGGLRQRGPLAAREGARVHALRPLRPASSPTRSPPPDGGERSPSS